MAKGLKIMNALAELMANGKGSKAPSMKNQLKNAQKPSMAASEENDNDDDNEVKAPKVRNAPTSTKPVKY